ncbi:tautomerase family protein [Pseudomonas sp. MAP12]|uniref:Tautomerase family protein n=1 Tax=Geopseudomonas aromaticivorans TaxID=2849492 RepID=A0ABS6MVX1_9GAMM|nr:tautomerase family protein [Pseudomonas aromaticivorans]MBV2132559.1 tautomerase family protein [Pseudomonas aromaticivorans]
MPVVNFHLLAGHSSAEQDQRLLEEASRLYSEVLKAPMERVRAFITTYPTNQFAVAGELSSSNGLHAPFFEFIVLDGRSLEDRQRLSQGFTELLVEVLGVRRELVRGRCQRVAPEDWSIGGAPASVLRADEVQARKAAEEGAGHEA